MVTVKIFGVFRLETGIKEMTAQAARVSELFPQIIGEAKRRNPQSAMTEKDLRGCIIAVNGRQATPKTELHPGDEVVLVPAAAGG